MHSGEEEQGYRVVCGGADSGLYWQKTETLQGHAECPNLGVLKATAHPVEQLNNEYMYSVYRQLCVLVQLRQFIDFFE